ncbi:hypothetical protein VNO78_12360 [Psophocarpus tetragonolobus]|uniref:Uncharacterized protein n=1 Tax=Psophocarpus tetragonolobus TaxID=3891 RepID=A0AAN9XNW9_PSOTE
MSVDSPDANCGAFDFDMDLPTTTRCWSDDVYFTIPPYISIESGVYCNGAIHWYHRMAENLIDVLELKEDYSDWSVFFRIDLHPLAVFTFPEMNMHWEKWIRLFRVFCIVREAREEDSLLVINIEKRVFSYKLVDPTLIELSQCQSIINAHADHYPPHVGTHFQFPLFQYNEYLSGLRDITF